MRTFVINLPNDPRRRAHASAQLRAAGLAFEFADGITGEEAVNRQLFERVDRKQFLVNTGREPTFGEIGCFAAHRQLWALCADLREPLMIMEDDFELSDTFTDAVCFAGRVIERAGFLRLQWNCSGKRRPIATDGALTLSIYTRAPQSTMCYCIAPQVARRFLDDTRVVEAPVDVFVRKYWRHRQPLFAITPYTVTAARLSYETTIRGRMKHRKHWRIVVQRFICKCTDHLQRIAFNLGARRDSAAVSRDLSCRRAGLREQSA